MNEPINVHKVFAEYFVGTEALAYALSSKLAEGHVCVDIESYKNELVQLAETKLPSFVTQENFEAQCCVGKYVSDDTDILKPFILCTGKAYLQRYFKYETQIIENIKRLGQNFRIITGGPGTGKTYSVSTELVKLFTGNADLKVALAAPTGKAAARVNESIKSFAENQANGFSDTIQAKLTGLKANTLHRLLGYQHNSVFFRHDDNNHLPFDVVIVDECSMIDGALMAKLLNSISDNTLLYLLGDKDQLASVEAGSVFGDMCRASNSDLLKEKIEFKTDSRRFDANKGIGKFSQEVIRGTLSGIDGFEQDEQVQVDVDYDEALFKHYALEYVDYIMESDIRKALEKLNKVRFLCVTRQNKYSVAETNQAIASILRNRINDVNIFNPSAGFYHNQPIMVTKNNYELGVFNGDVGIVRNEHGTLIAHFENTDGDIKKISAGYLSEYETVFAMTIHKSQGSEFDHVVVILPEQHGGKLLTKELLYTGVTRAKSKVLVQSNEAILLQCVNTEVARSSGLQERIINANSL